jgi:hypothetical protein
MSRDCGELETEQLQKELPTGWLADQAQPSFRLVVFGSELRKEIQVTFYITRENDQFAQQSKIFWAGDKTRILYHFDQVFSNA